MYMYICIYTYLSLYIYVYIYIYTYVYIGASCSDGVNVFSFWCLLEYRRHVRSGNNTDNASNHNDTTTTTTNNDNNTNDNKGLAARTAPEHTHSGGYSLDRMWAVWNCSVMRPLLPRRGRHLWVTPTVGGRLNPLLALRGNHLSNASCLTQVFFKSGEECGKLW